MGRRPPRLLYIDSFSGADFAGEPPSSDAIGYGISSSSAIRQGLEAAGFSLTRLRPSPPPAGQEFRLARVRWIVDGYARLVDALAAQPPDAVFVFHAFNAFPGEIRRILLDLGLRLPLVGYTHGSHWDPTDAYRVEAYPGMELVDLANLSVLDRILLVSRYLRQTLLASIGAFNAPLAASLEWRMAVVGLPLDTAALDAARTDEREEQTTIVFNHAPVSSKNPALFARVAGRILARHPARVLFTRRFRAGDPGAAEVHGLAARFPAQVTLGGDMALPDYYRALWRSHIQVSTATHESLGIATLEAMYARNCCVLPRLGSYPELCDGDPEVLYELGEDQLEQRLVELLEDPGRRERIAARLARLALRQHPGEVVERIAGVLEGCLRDGGGGSCGAGA